MGQWRLCILKEARASSDVELSPRDSNSQQVTGVGARSPVFQECENLAFALDEVQGDERT